MNYTDFVKQAGIYTDFVKAVPGNAVASALCPVAGPALMLGGTIAGAASDTPEALYNEEWKKYIPGMSSAGLVGQRRALSRRYGNKRDKSTAVSEQFGWGTAGIGAGILGAGLGGIAGATLLGPKGAGVGALAGAVAPIVTGEAVAALAALLRRTRTRKEQADYEQSDKLINWLLPGMGSYNLYKSWGRLHNDQKEEKQARG